MGLADSLLVLANQFGQAAASLARFSVAAEEAARTHHGRMRAPGHGQTWHDYVMANRFGGYATMEELQVAIGRQLKSGMGIVDQTLFDMRTQQQANMLDTFSRVVALGPDDPRAYANFTSAGYAAAHPQNYAGPLIAFEAPISPSAAINLSIYAAQSSISMAGGASLVPVSGNYAGPILAATVGGYWGTTGDPRLSINRTDAGSPQVTNSYSGYSDPRVSMFGDPQLIANILGTTGRIF